MSSPSSESEGRGSPFMRLAGYIGVMGAPENEDANKIAMTAPVVRKQHEGVMQFILPSAMDELSKIPKPTHSDVAVEEIPPAVGAVVRYSGHYSEENHKAHGEEFAKQLREDGLDMDEEEFMENHQVWGYDPPRTPPNLRRNEIWIELTEEQVEELRKSKSNDVDDDHEDDDDEEEDDDKENHIHEHTHGDVAHTHVHENGHNQPDQHSKGQLQEEPHSHEHSHHVSTQEDSPQHHSHHQSHEQLRTKPHSHPHLHDHSHEHSHGDLDHSHPHSHSHTHIHAHSVPGQSHDGAQNMEHAHQVCFVSI